MDKNLHAITNIRIQRTITALEKNNMAGYYAANTDELKKLLDTLVADGETIGIGGSQTLFETGTIDYIKSRNVNFLDRNAEGLTREELVHVLRQALLADTFFTSTNALTEQGELYNIDGSGSRVSAMIFGPMQIIVICGANKIVPDMDAAIMRLRTVAAPANAERLHVETPCTKVGHCMDCANEKRICCHFVRQGFQRAKNRIKVIIMPDSYGY